ncbi:hypothetical protein [Candidatus Mycoplasma mahonii]|uniref:hypothetical protein n=1 Tax=Candidatus Mycoplasma mahonii TaxID=3004105 RepID=UPI0026F30D83|nr:hypothetical protein [Candidatus Mycoplasma mahonii]WKX02752.1 hypothetical protein O3I44_01620 [Candidatus Mycoplasma mahonii]
MLKNNDIIEENYKLSIINMCISYEAYISDLFDMVFHKNPKYNHPWSNTREIINRFKIDVTNEYKNAHDAWDYYNTLKHINQAMNHEYEKLVKNMI